MKFRVFLLCLIVLVWKLSAVSVESSGFELKLKNDYISAKITNDGVSLKTSYFRVGTPSDTGILQAIDKASFQSNLIPEVGVNKTYKNSRIFLINWKNKYVFTITDKKNSICFISSEKRLSTGVLLAFPGRAETAIQDSCFRSMTKYLLYPLIQYEGRYLGMQCIGEIDSNMYQKYKIKIRGKIHGFSASYSRGSLSPVLSDGDHIETFYELGYHDAYVAIQYSLAEGRTPIYSYESRKMKASFSVELQLDDFRLYEKINATYEKGRNRITEDVGISWKQWTMEMDESGNPSLSFQTKAASFTIGKGKTESLVTLSFERGNCFVVLKASSKKFFSMEVSLKI